MEIEVIATWYAVIAAAVLAVVVIGNRRGWFYVELAGAMVLVIGWPLVPIATCAALILAAYEVFPDKAEALWHRLTTRKALGAGE